MKKVFSLIFILSMAILCFNQNSVAETGLYMRVMLIESPTSGTGNINYTGLDFQPKIIIPASVGTADENVNADASFSFGTGSLHGTSIEQSVIAVNSEKKDYISPYYTNSGRRQANTLIYARPTYTGDLDQKAALDAMLAPNEVTGTDSEVYTCIKDHTAANSNKPITGSDWQKYWIKKGTTGGTWSSGTSYKTGGFKLDWKKIDGSAVSIGVLAIGGPDVENASTGYIDIRSGEGTQDITADFDPDAVIFYSTGGNTDYPQVNAVVTIGAVDRVSNGQWSVGTLSRDNLSVSDTYKVQKDDECIYIFKNDGTGSKAEAEFVSWITNGIRINWTTNNTSDGTKLHYLFIKGPRMITKIINTGTSTGTENKVDRTGFGFNQYGSLLFSTGSIYDNPGKSDNAILSVGAGLRMSSGDRFSVGFEDKDYVSANSGHAMRRYSKSHAYSIFNPEDITVIDCKGDVFGGTRDGIAIYNHTNGANCGTPSDYRICVLAFGPKQLSHGPVFGGVTEDSIKIWVRQNDYNNGSGREIKLRYSVDDELTNYTEASGLTPDSDDDYSAIFTVLNLQADTRYYFQVLVDGVEQLAVPFPSCKTLPSSGEVKIAFMADIDPTGRKDQDIHYAVDNKGPDLIISMGDHSSSNASHDLEIVRAGFKNIAWPWASGGDFVKRLYWKYPFEYIYDDHELKNNADKTVVTGYKVTDVSKKSMPMGTLSAPSDVTGSAEYGATNSLTDNDVDFTGDPYKVYPGMTVYKISATEGQSVVKNVTAHTLTFNANLTNGQTFASGGDYRIGRGGLWRNFTIGDNLVEVFILDLRRKRDPNSTGVNSNCGGDMLDGTNYGSDYKTSGTVNTYVANKLVDTTKNFSNLGVVVGDLVKRTSGGSGYPQFAIVKAIETTTNENDTIALWTPRNDSLTSAVSGTATGGTKTEIYDDGIGDDDGVCEQIEISDDCIGDDDGLCESGEDCYDEPCKVTLVDTMKNFSMFGVKPAMLVRNDSTGCSGFVKEILTTTYPNDTIRFANIIEGGTRQSFQNGDDYIISEDFNLFANGNESYEIYESGASDHGSKSANEAKGHIQREWFIDAVNNSTAAQQLIVSSVNFNITNYAIPQARDRWGLYDPLGAQWWYISSKITDKENKTMISGDNNFGAGDSGANTGIRNFMATPYNQGGTPLGSVWSATGIWDIGVWDENARRVVDTDDDNNSYWGFNFGLAEIDSSDILLSIIDYLGTERVSY